MWPSSTVCGSKRQVVTEKTVVVVARTVDTFTAIPLATQTLNWPTSSHPISQQELYRLQQQLTHQPWYCPHQPPTQRKPIR